MRVKAWIRRLWREIKRKLGVSLIMIGIWVAQS